MTKDRTDCAAVKLSTLPTDGIRYELQGEEKKLNITKCRVSFQTRD